MKMLQTGDTCPICGQPIQTEDPNKLILLSAIGWFKEQNNCGTFDLCAAGNTGATNADKLRSLPDDTLNNLVFCPAGKFGEKACPDFDKDTMAFDCVKCGHEWARLPYTGWEA